VVDCLCGSRNDLRRVIGMSYATLDDLKSCGLPAGALAGVAFDVQNQALEDRSAYADGFIGDTCSLPLARPYDRTLVRCVCHLATWDLLLLRGFNPAVAGDAAAQYRAEQAEKWLLRVANKQVRLAVPENSNTSIQPDVATNCPRGWGDLDGSGTTDVPRVLV
jgi:phage gp36-like protein